MNQLHYTFSKDERLRKKKDIDGLFKKRRVYTGKNLQLFVNSRSDSLKKVGFLLSRRVGIAVQRNRLRRLLRESYRLNKEQVVCGKSIMIRVKRPIKKANLAILEAEFLYLAQQAGILKGRNVSRETFSGEPAE